MSRRITKHPKSAKSKTTVQRNIWWSRVLDDWVVRTAAAKGYSTPQDLIREIVSSTRESQLQQEQATA